MPGGIYQLKKTVNQVFKHKGIEKKFPIKFSKADYKQFEKHWEQYREKNKLTVKEINLPKKFEKIVSELNTFLSKIIYVAVRQSTPGLPGGE